MSGALNVTVTPLAPLDLPPGARLLVRVPDRQFRVEQAQRMQEVIAHWSGLPREAILFVGPDVDLYVAEAGPDGEARLLWTAAARDESQAGES